jgi:hypothetical protein
LKTGNVSPQFHFRVDPTFQTVHKAWLLKSEWQVKCHFAPSTSNKGQPQSSPPVTSVQVASPVEAGNPSGGNGRDQSEGHAQSEEGHLPSTEQVVHPPEGADTQGSHVSNAVPAQTTRLGRQIRQPQRYVDSFTATVMETSQTIVAYEVICDIHDDAFADNNVHPLIAYAASADPDTMYLHEAMQQLDREQFLKAMQKEIADQSNNGNWKIIHCSHIPEGT